MGECYMSNKEPTFGGLISETRKEKGISQKELAAMILKEDGEAIAPQYLNDIEHGRRSPSSDHLIKQFAEKLDLVSDYLFFLAGKFPTDISRNLPQNKVIDAMVSFRKTPKK